MDVSLRTSGDGLLYILYTIVLYTSNNCTRTPSLMHYTCDSIIPEKVELTENYLRNIEAWFYSKRQQKGKC